MTDQQTNPSAPDSGIKDASVHSGSNPPRKGRKRGRKKGVKLWQYTLARAAKTARKARGGNIAQSFDLSKLSEDQKLQLIYRKVIIGRKNIKLWNKTRKQNEILARANLFGQTSEFPTPGIPYLQSGGL